MAYIIMCRDECNEEVRHEGQFSSRSEAEEWLDKNPPPEEYRSVWVEELRDKAYYAKRQMIFDDDYPFDHPEDHLDYC